jgi:CRISPR/Cas system CMR-associated protein Cmr1 (group 7 of RAMP superfamily)
LSQEVRSILDELNALSIEKDKENIVESRAVNLIEYIQENYNEDTALELERRLVNSIRGRDSKKFSRAIHKLKENKNK